MQNIYLDLLSILGVSSFHYASYLSSIFRTRCLASILQPLSPLIYSHAQLSSGQPPEITPSKILLRRGHSLQTHHRALHKYSGLELDSFLWRSGIIHRFVGHNANSSGGILIRDIDRNASIQFMACYRRTQFDGRRISHTTSMLRDWSLCKLAWSERVLEGVEDRYNGPGRSRLWYCRDILTETT